MVSDTDLAAKTIVADSPEKIDELVNEFRKNNVVRFNTAVPRPDGKYERYLLYIATDSPGITTKQEEIRKAEAGFDEEKLKKLESLEPRTQFQKDFLESIIASYKKGWTPTEKRKPHYKKVLEELGEKYDDYFKG